MKLIILVLFSFLQFTHAHAYLDPGSGGFLIQMIIAFFVSILIFFKSIWYKTKEIFSKCIKFFSKDKNTNYKK